MFYVGRKDAFLVSVWKCSVTDGCHAGLVANCSMLRKQDSALKLMSALVVSGRILHTETAVTTTSQVWWNLRLSRVTIWRSVLEPVVMVLPWSTELASNFLRQTSISQTFITHIRTVTVMNDEHRLTAAALSSSQVKLSCLRPATSSTSGLGLGTYSQPDPAV